MPRSTSSKASITERGWPGHFICASRCLFRRNTLVEYKDTKIVVSTVGLMKTISPEYKDFEPIGLSRYFETMAFHADPNDTRFHDADVSKQVLFESPWCIDEADADDKANEMHEAVVAEISKRLLKGETFPTHE